MIKLHTVLQKEVQLGYMSIYFLALFVLLFPCKCMCNSSDVLRHPQTLEREN